MTRASLVSVTVLGAFALACGSATEPPPSAQATSAAPASAPQSAATPAPVEGDDPGECSDGADNDRDGKFDCDDSDCGGAPSCKTPPPTETKSGLQAYSVPLTAPWTEMNLPVKNGAVLYSDQVSVTISYDGGSVNDLASQYEYAINAEHWDETFKSTDGGMVTVTYSRGDKSLTFAAMEAMGIATVSLTMI